MYVINPAPGPQDLQPTVSSYVSAEALGAVTHRSESPAESIEQHQQQKQRKRKELLSRILTKCTFDMSEEVATFSSPGEKTPPRTAAAAAAATESGNSSTPPTAEGTSPLRPEADGSEQQNGPADVAGISPLVTANGPGPDAAVCGTPSPGSLRAVSPDRSPVRSTGSSSNTSLSPSSLAETAKPSGACEVTEGDQPLSAKPSAVSNFASVVHPKERALKSIAAAAAAAEAAAAAAVAASSPTSDRNSSSSTNGADGKVKPPVAGGLMVASSGGRALLNGAHCTPGAAAPGNIGVGTGTAVHGGRLQFFKDGKFILELARAKEGEKTSWISVPRKTYWPPTVSSTSANFHKHESSTSLSFSDDNSSIQSSPWQRDHCWKQANPRANISKELALYYFRPPNVRFRLARDTRARLRRKRRRPYEATMPSDMKQNEAGPLLPFVLEERRDRHRRSDPTTSTTSTKGKEDSSEGPSGGGGSKKPTEDDGCNGETPMDTSEPTPPAAPSEGEEAERQDATSKPSKSRKKPPARATEGKKDTNSKPRNGHHHPLTNGHHHPHGPSEDAGRGRCKRPVGKDLAAIVQALSEQQQQRVATAASLAPAFRLGAITGGNGTVRNAVFGSGSAAQHVSPRKRILRELEKVSLEDGGSGGSTMKRSRPKSGTSGGGSAASTPVIVTATTATPLSTLPTNGAGSAINGSSSNNAGNSSGSSNNASRTNGHVNGTGSGSNGTVGAGGKHLSNGVGSRSPVAAPSTPAPPAAPISRPISSYSITSLLGHTSTQSNESSSSEAATAGAAHRKPDHNSSTSHSGSVASVTSTASHYHHQQQQQLHAHLNHHHHPLSPHQQQYQQQLLTSSPKSPTMMDPHHQHPFLQHGYPQSPYHHGSNRYHGAGSKKRSPNYGNGGSPGAMEHGGVPYGGGAIRSPDLSPSPEHHHHHHHHQSHHAPAASQQPQHHHPAHHTGSGFTRYRQHPYGGSPGSSSYSSAQSSSARFSPSPSTNDSTTPPYVRSSSSSYRAAYLAGNSSGSPPAANGSPQHYSRASPLNFGRGALLSSPPPSSGSAHHLQQQQQQNHRGGTTSPRASPTSTGSSSGSHGNSVATATTPTSAMAALTTGSSSSPSNVRTVPKKTAALRQPFATGGHSPSRERSHSNASSSSSSLSVKKELQLLSDSTGSAAAIDSVDGPVSLSSAAMHYAPGMPASSGASGVIRPSTVIASPSPHHHHHHPAAANPFYSLYPPQLAASLLSAGHGVPPSPSGSSAANSPANAAVLAAAAFHPAAAAAASLTSYYQQMYSAATMAAAYRNPLWMHYPGLAAVAPQGPGHHMIAPPPPSSAAAAAMIGSSEGRRMDHRHHATASPPPLPTPLSQGIPPSTSSPPIHVDNRSSEQHQHHQRLHSSQSIPAISTAAALNYSVTALTSTSSSSSSVGAAAPPGSWVGGEGGGYPHHDHSIAAPAAKEDPSNDLPLNLSKH